MKRKIYLLQRNALRWALALWALPAMSQKPAPPADLPRGLEPLAKPQSNANWIDFREEVQLKAATLFTDHKRDFGLTEEDSMVLVKKSTDNLNFTHFKYQQYHKKHRVVYGEYIVHQQPDGNVGSANGRMIRGIRSQNTAANTNEKQALAIALGHMKAQKYLWENSEMEKELKRQRKDPQATYFPKGELVYAPAGDIYGDDYRLAWCFRIYPDDPKVVAKAVYVDASNGQVIHAVDIAMVCSTGSGQSAFNGNVTVRSRAGGFLSYQSHDDCQPTDLIVYNCNGGAAANVYYTDFLDNVWNAPEQISAVQAIFGTRATYDYLKLIHNRDGWDGAASNMVSYNNAFLGSNNACWNCVGNSAIFYAGSTNSANDDWNTVDIVGHEFAHGVTQDEAGLVYQNESGALNESFSDIFGDMTESTVEGINDWLVGGDRTGGAIRSLRNPNLFNDPDTYLGTNWYTGSGDNGGVHINSGVQNFWFYLLSQGGSGTNDFGRAYNVTAIDRFKARQIAYRALTVYLTSTSRYIDARTATLRAARDIYGGCSTEEIAVGNAWAAVNVESQSTVFTVNACGTFPFIFFSNVQEAISQVNAGGPGCTTTIIPSTTQIVFVARDRVILRPGFTAQAGSRFVAYTNPCSVTRWASATGADDAPMSDAERGIKPELTILNPAKPAATAMVMPEEAAAGTATVVPNPFRSTFDVTIRAEKDARAKITLFSSVGAKLQERQGVQLTKGINRTTFNGAGLASGVYLVEILIDGKRTVKKITKL